MSSGGGGGAVTPGSGPGGLNNQEVNGLMQTIDQQKKNIEEYENKSKLMQKEIEDLKLAAKDLVPAVNVCTSQKRTLEPFLEPLSHQSTPWSILFCSLISCHALEQVKQAMIYRCFATGL